MGKTVIVKFDWFFLLFISVFTLIIILYAASPWDNDAFTTLQDYFYLIGVLLLGISPYTAMGIALSFFSKKNLLIKTFSVCIFTISLLSGFIMIDAMFIHPDAQGALTLIFLPIYQWIVLFTLLLILPLIYIFNNKDS